MGSYAQKDTQADMKRPLLKVAVAFIDGDSRRGFCSCAVGWLFVCLRRIAMVALLVKHARWVAVGLFFSSWMGEHGWRTAVIAPSDLRALLSDKPEIVTVRGSLDASPAEHIFERNHEEAMRTVAYVNASAIERGTNIQIATGEIVVMTPGILG